MMVEFAKAWRWFKAGQVVQLDRGRADILCKANICRPAEQPSAAVEVAEAPQKPKRRRSKKKAD